MAALFQLRCDYEQVGLEFEEGASESALEARLVAYTESCAQKEKETISPDVADYLWHERDDLQLPEPVKRKLRSLLQELEAKNFDLETRNADLYIFAHNWGIEFELVNDFESAETFYEAALRAADCPAGRRALAEIHGNRDLIGVERTALANLSNKQGRLHEAESLYLSILDTPGQCFLAQNAILCQLSTMYFVMQAAAKFKNTMRRWKKFLTSHGSPEDCYSYSYYHHMQVQLCRNDGKMKEATECEEKVVACYKASFGNASYFVAQPLGALARLYAEEGRCEEASQALEHCLAIVQRPPDLKRAEQESGHPFSQLLQDPVLALQKQEQMKALFLACMGEVRSIQGRLAEALSLFERAFKLKVDHSSPNTGILMAAHSTVLQRLGRYQEALPVIERARSHLEGILGPQAVQTLAVKVAMAIVLMELERSAEATKLLEATHKLALETTGPDSAITRKAGTELALAQNSGDVSASNESDQGPVYVLPTSMSVRCGACNKKEAEGVKYKVCSKCKRAKYCSAECQKAAWKEHKKECRPLPV